jgi:cell division protein FtsB
MGAAKRMYDNSYNQRLETEAIAKAYLESPKVEAKETVQSEKQIKNGRICNVIGIFSSMVYCLLIFALIVMPLVKETFLHKMNIEISSHRQEIKTLEKNIEDLEKSLNAVHYLNVEEIAKTELNMVQREDSMRRPLLKVEKVSLEEAKSAFYSMKIDYTSNSKLD